MKQHRKNTIGTAVLATALALVFGSTAQAKPTPSFTPIYGNTTTYINALQVRSQALNEKYGPTNALRLRSEAMNAKYGLGDFATGRNVGYLRARHLSPEALTENSHVTLQRAATPTATQSTGGIDLHDGLVGGAALFATILAVGAAIIMTQRRQMRPLGV